MVIPKDMETEVLQFVQANKVLYDKAEPGQENIDVKEEVWKKVVEKLGRAAEEIKRWWRTICTPGSQIPDRPISTRWAES